MARPRVPDPVTGGTDSMRRVGKKPTLVALTEAERAVLDRARKAAGVAYLSHFLRDAGLELAKSILRKKGK